MQMRKAAALRDAWVRNGNLPCDHPNLEREYDLGSDTGDHVCTTCGAANRREVLEAEGKVNTGQL